MAIVFFVLTIQNRRRKIVRSSCVDENILKGGGEIGFKDSKDFIQESTISYIHQEYVVCYD